MVAVNSSPLIVSELAAEITNGDLDQTLPPIGSLDFFPALVNHLTDKPSCPPVDPSVLQSILLCIVAGDKHLILRTHEADVGAVAKVAASVSAAPFSQLSCVLQLNGRP
jgi:hypothetical protein